MSEDRPPDDSAGPDESVGPDESTASAENAAPVSGAAPGNGSEEAPPVEGDGYRVTLDQFEGPLDLLLYLIKREEVDVTDIPIARITDQFLESLGDVESLDLDRAGEFLLMASTLMRIKARMLIPRDPDEEEDEDAIDPRAELVRRLLEYREFKRVAEALGERQEEWRGIFSRASAPIPEEESEELGDLGVGLLDLFRAFRSVLERIETERPFDVDQEEYAVDEQMDFIRDQCALNVDGVAFRRLFEDRRSRAFVITTFLAILELIRERDITASQVDLFGEIWLKTYTEAARTHEP